MAESIVKRLQRESAELRQRLDHFRALLGDVLEPGLLDVLGPEAKSRMINSMSAAEIGPHLREVALRCQSLARESVDARAGRALQDVGMELTEQSAGLEAIFTIPNAAREP